MFEKKKKEIMFDEKSTNKVLTVIYSNIGSTKVSLTKGKIGDGEGTVVWVVEFKASKDIFGTIISDLKKIGYIDVEVEEDGHVDLHFKED